MIPGVEITLADGKVYTFPPLALASLQKLQEKLFAYKGGVDADSVATVIMAAQQSLSRNYPEIKRADLVGVFTETEEGDIVWITPALIDIGNMLDVMNAVMDVSGVKRKAQEAGKAAASLSTGISSTAT
jgi:hypothetical protein